MTDMATMPIRELIADMREQTSKMDNADFIKILFVNVIAGRLEEQANLVDTLTEVKDAVLAHRDNDEFLNVGTWNACVAAAEKADEVMKDVAQN